MPMKERPWASFLHDTHRSTHLPRASLASLGGRGKDGECNVRQRSYTFDPHARTAIALKEPQREWDLEKKYCILKVRNYKELYDLQVKTHAELWNIYQVSEEQRIRRSEEESSQRTEQDDAKTGGAWAGE